MTPTFSGLHFWTRDINATVAFYRAVGFEIDEPFEGEFVRLTLPGGAELAFGTYGLTERYDPAFTPPAPGGKSAAIVQFHVESRSAVDEMHARLAGLGYGVHLAPIDAFWGARYCESTDPDGNVVGFHGRD